jgi:DNA polymerase-1
MSDMIFDLETTIIQKYKRKANPFIKDNWVVEEGWWITGDEQASWRYMTEDESRGSFMHIPAHVTVLVGFNIKFDLLWELARTNKDLEAFLKRGGRIWCCQYAEYLLRAQHPNWQMCSLNDTAIAYGGTTKIDMVKAMWEDGINTPDIPEDLLTDYLVGTVDEKRMGGDIGNTKLVYDGQVKKAEKLGMMTMIKERMDGLLATVFMEHYGLKVDTAFAKVYLKEQQAALQIATTDLNTFIPELPKGFVFNWNSNVHKSCLLYGGAAKYSIQVPYKDDTGEWARYNLVEKWPLFDKVAVDRHAEGIILDTDTGLFMDVIKMRKQDVNKGGQNMGAPKFKNVTVKGEKKVRFTDFIFDFEGYTKPSSRWKGELLDARGKPIYGAGADIVEELTAMATVPFLVSLGRYSALTKEIGTYLVARGKKGELKGMLTCVDPVDHIIHHKINHVNTITSRLSSSDPNLQNLPRGDKSKVKQMFISRFKDGLMVEADYSQLEVVVQGVLTKDEQLCEDLRNRIDFHCKRVSASKGCSYEDALEWCKNEAHIQNAVWKVFRTHAKIFSFQRAYGAAAKTIAKSTGMDVKDVEALIAQEMVMYPDVETFYERVEDEIIASAEFIKCKRDNGSYGTYRRGTYIAPTGTRYSWRSYDTPKFLRDRGIMEQFAQPEIRNYPVQGTGGEFVQGILGLLIRDLIRNDFYGGGMFDPRAVLCNTVHDCVWYDCFDEELSRTVWADIKPIMESIPEWYNKNHGMDISVPFPVDGEVGLNMNQLKHFH